MVQHGTCAALICPWCVFLPSSRAMHHWASNAAPAGVFGALSVKLSVNQFVRQPGLGTTPDTLSASSGIHPFDGHRVEHPKFGRWAFTGKSQKVGRFVRRWRMEQICAIVCEYPKDTHKSVTVFKTVAKLQPDNFGSQTCNRIISGWSGDASKWNHHASGGAPQK